VDDLPLIGDSLKSPLSAAGSAAHQIALAGQGLNEKASTLAIVLSLAVAIPPALMIGLPWLWLRIRFIRRAGATATLATVPGGQRLLALRALANRPLPAVSAAVPGQDPLEAWRREDPQALYRLASLELKRAGVPVPYTWRAPAGPPALEA
jgi:hypothetical protein